MRYIKRGLFWRIFGRVAEYCVGPPALNTNTNPYHSRLSGMTKAEFNEWADEWQARNNEKLSKLIFGAQSLYGISINNMPIDARSLKIETTNKSFPHATVVRGDNSIEEWIIERVTHDVWRLAHLQSSARVDKHQ